MAPRAADIPFWIFANGIPIPAVFGGRPPGIPISARRAEWTAIFVPSESPWNLANKVFGVPKNWGPNVEKGPRPEATNQWKRRPHMTTLNRRAHPRVPYEAPVLLAEEHSKFYLESRLWNFSKNGMYLETSEPFAPDSVLRIRMGGYSPDGSGPGAFQWFLANIQWRRAVQRDGQNLFGLGAKIMQRSHESLENIFHSSTISCDLCGDDRARSDVHVGPEFLAFCQDCDEDLDTAPEGQAKRSLYRFLKGNVL
jgi:hypothetical protein